MGGRNGGEAWLGGTRPGRYEGAMACMSEGSMGEVRISARVLRKHGAQFI